MNCYTTGLYREQFEHMFASNLDELSKSTQMTSEKIQWNGYLHVNKYSFEEVCYDEIAPLLWVRKIA